MLVTTTDAFTMDDLLAGEKTAIIIHAGADNFGQHSAGSLQPGQRGTRSRRDDNDHR